MSGDWIKMRVDLADDPAVIEMAAVLGLDEYGVTGRLHKLWSWADKHCADGHAKSVTFVWIDRFIGNDGFAVAMQNVGWLAQTGTGTRFPRFDRHNGENAKKRAEARERQRLARERAAAVTQASHAKCDKHVTRDRLEIEVEIKADALVTSLPAGDLLGDPLDLAPLARPECPHKEIIALYHEILPQCPRVRVWTPARATALRNRWNEDPERQSLDSWRTFFEYVARCDFLVGRGTGARPFFADLEWMVKSANFTKIIEGKYAN
jgi:hypothetical protein